MTFRTLVMMGSGALAAFAVSVLLENGDRQASAATADDEAAAKDAVKEAVSKGELLMVKGGATADYAPYWLGGPMAPDVKRKFKAKVAHDFGEVFSPTLAAEYGSSIEAFASSAEGPPPNAGDQTAAQVERMPVGASLRATGPDYPIVKLDAGVSNILFSETSISGDTATVTATVESWGKVAQVRDGIVYPAYPHNIIAVRETLQRQGDKWLIVDRQWNFVPGGGP